MYLLLFPLGAFGIIYVPSAIIVPGDVTATIENIRTHESLFRLSIVSAFLVQIVNMGVALCLYRLLKPVNKISAIMMLGFILAAVPLAMLNELNNFSVLILLRETEPSTMLLSLFLDLHEHGVMIAGIFWGLWLFPMGHLIYKSGFLPKFLGVLLMIGCFGYLLDSFIFFLNPEFGFKFAGFLFIGELTLPLWLLAKGVNTERWNALK